MLFFSIAGKYLFLSPYRNSHQPQIGQRGFGYFVRIDMNMFNLAGVDMVDMTTLARAQIPSFADIDLRCFSGGFACKFLYVAAYLTMVYDFAALSFSWYIWISGSILQWCIFR